MNQESTIAAISTPMGTGGIGIVRLSGPDAVAIAEQIFAPYQAALLKDIPGYTGCLGKLHDHGDVVDEAIAFVYRAPKSYTGEDIVELSCHGGLWIVQRVLRLCLEHGAQPAGPGEFTKRAYLNGKLDLLQAEAVMELIQASSDAALQAALTSHEGALGKQIGAVTGELIARSAHIAAWSDYPDEDMVPVDTAALRESLQDCLERLERLLSSYDQGRLLREGIQTAIVGRPNVGKSTLMNLLSGQQRSIVTEIPGTTRDVVEDTVRVGELVLRLSDTAGIRATDDVIERIGVDRSKQMLASAQLVLAVFDSSQALDGQDLEVLELLRGKPCIAVINKIDLEQRLDLDRIGAAIDRVVSVSAATGKGRDRLEREITDCVGMRGFSPSQAIVTNERQRKALSEAVLELSAAIEAIGAGMTLDAVNIAIDSALDILLLLRGEKASDVVIDEVFARFCVGK